MSETTGFTTQEVTLIHKEGQDIRRISEVSIHQAEDKSLNQELSCEHCDETIQIVVRSRKSVLLRYLLLILPSLIAGGYLIITRAINQGIDTLILSITLYTIFGFIGYLALMSSLLNSFLKTVKVKNSKNHEVSE